MQRITCLADIAEGVDRLRSQDPALGPVIETAGTIPLRLRPPGFEGLARIVVGQQVSVASADAIWKRLTNAFPQVAADAIAAADAETLRACGLSRPKVRTFHAISSAVMEDGLDLEALAEMPAEAAQQRLIALPGIGPWSAEVYLMFCAGHPDIFPAGDVALQNAVRDADGLMDRPDEQALRDHALRWAPLRSVAARIFWAYYRACRSGRESLPV